MKVHKTQNRDKQVINIVENLSLSTVNKEKLILLNNNNDLHTVLSAGFLKVFEVVHRLIETTKLFTRETSRQTIVIT
jgi:hypothetical protein